MLLGQHSARRESLRRHEAQFDNNDVVMMQYTSGTTGLSGSASCSRIAQYHPATDSILARGRRVGPTDRITLPVPFFHCFGCVLGVMASLTHRSTMSHRRGFQRKPGLAGGSQGTSHGALRRAHHVHCGIEFSRVRPVRPFQPSYGHHGGKPLSSRDHA